MSTEVRRASRTARARAEVGMYNHDNEVESAARRTDSTTLREQETNELAGRAAAERRVGALDTASVLHLQASAGNASVSGLIAEEDGATKVRDVIGSGGGDRLDPSVKGDMEQRFGQRFDDVRVHRGGRASESAQSVNANAYTVGSHVVFRDGRYDPDSDGGRRTLAHELAHVVQQREGAVDGSPIGGGLRVSHPADPYEQAAERTADTVMAGSATAPSPSAPAHAQREQTPEEEEELQTETAQRQEEEEEELQTETAQRQEEEEEELQTETAQRQEEEEEEMLQPETAQRQEEDELEEV